MKKIYFYLLSGGFIVSTDVEVNLSPITVEIKKVVLIVPMENDLREVKNFTLFTAHVIGTWSEEM